MSRNARVDIAGHPYHVINRAVMKLEIFESDQDYELFEEIIEKAQEETGMRILAYVVMPNHWHFLLYPKEDGDMSIFMHRLTSTHTRKVRAETLTNGTGPLYQGRYKSFLIEKDTYLQVVHKYIERNPARAGLVKKAEDWRWGSVWRRTHGTQKHKKLLYDDLLTIPKNYSQWINTPESPKELVEIRESIKRGKPLGKDSWVEETIKRFGLESTVRNQGRPRGRV